MHKLLKGLVIVSVAMLAGCQAAPVAVAPKVAAPEPQPLPYRWTHGNAEKSRKAMIDNFHRAWLAAGDFVWAEQIPAEGDPKMLLEASRLGDASRQNLLAAHELVAREAQARRSDESGDHLLADFRAEGSR